MIVVRLMGGLGNQMFQYAFAKTVSIERHAELALDHTLLDAAKARAVGDTAREYGLGVFALPDRIALSNEIVAFNGADNPSLWQRLHYRLVRATGRYPLVIQRGHDFDETQIRRIGKSACLVGRWQSEKYFSRHAAEIRRLFTFHAFRPTSHSLDAAAIANSERDVVVQVRRGDQVTHPLYRVQAGAYTAQYYRDAIEFHRRASNEKRPCFFVVSDDSEWCREAFRGLSDVFVVEQEKSEWGAASDLWLMTQFRHFVISNSTFGWWGAWLGERPGSRVVAPATWARQESNRPPFLIPDRWARISGTFEPLS